MVISVFLRVPVLPRPANESTRSNPLSETRKHIINKLASSLALAAANFCYMNEFRSTYADSPTCNGSRNDRFRLPATTSTSSTGRQESASHMSLDSLAPLLLLKTVPRPPGLVSARELRALLTKNFESNWQLPQLDVAANLLPTSEQFQVSSWAPGIFERLTRRLSLFAINPFGLSKQAMHPVQQSSENLFYGAERIAPLVRAMQMNTPTSQPTICPDKSAASPIQAPTQVRPTTRAAAYKRLKM
ncbi:unnamed protein product [Protopolystoma xenopodis]|uniref:Uncharacterized protein n=1 Tax=Protopolystoma xenopodis TaxID=117903 RepID=A0A448X039_9PLAT|nr:unnamed protein product [Protopolystoma xenopodis]